MNKTDWFLGQAIEVYLKRPDDFNVVRETLTRMGVAKFSDKELVPSCLILHKKGRYFIVHFKEMFILDGKRDDYSDTDRGRRNLIAHLLETWGLVTLAEPERVNDRLEPNKVFIISYQDKANWKINHKYTIGAKPSVWN